MNIYRPDQHLIPILIIALLRICLLGPLNMFLHLFFIILLHLLRLLLLLLLLLVLIPTKLQIT